MKDKMASNGDHAIRQEPWALSPCHECSGAPCCRNLPLAPLRLESQRDFVNLLLVSSYEGLYPALKRNGEWTVYLQRDCRFLDRRDGKCGIHGEARQSMVCKSYDAHNCWYRDAFGGESLSSLIPFDTEGLIWLERTYGLIERRFAAFPEWNGLEREIRESGRQKAGLSSRFKEDPVPRILSFRKSRAGNYLFLPPWERPRTDKHFELLSFRLGFPGVYLAMTDTVWSFLVITSLDPFLLKPVREAYYPALGHEDGIYSFTQVRERLSPHSGNGEQWLIIRRPELPLLKAMTRFDASGNVTGFPSCSEVLAALRSTSPDRAA